MRTLILFILSVSITGAYSQEQRHDSLSKYAHNIFCAIGYESSTGGTGFIVSSKSKMFLVTNLHVVIKGDPSQKNVSTETPFTALSVQFRLKRNQADTFLFFPTRNINQRVNYLTYLMLTPEGDSLYHDVVVQPVEIPSEVLSDDVSLSDLDYNKYPTPGDRSLVIPAYPGHEFQLVNTKEILGDDTAYRFDPYIYFDYGLKGGASGSPIFYPEIQTGKNKVVGIVSRGNSKEGALIKGVGVPAFYIREMIEHLSQ